MAKGFTPLIGLAVVMALALAAVFGSMSLANPAWAQMPKTMTDRLRSQVYLGRRSELLSWEPTRAIRMSDGDGDAFTALPVRRKKWVTPVPAYKCCNW